MSRVLAKNRTQLSAQPQSDGARKQLRLPCWQPALAVFQLTAVLEQQDGCYQMPIYRTHIIIPNPTTSMHHSALHAAASLRPALPEGPVVVKDVGAAHASGVVRPNVPGTVVCVRAADDGLPRQPVGAIDLQSDAACRLVQQAASSLMQIVHAQKVVVFSAQSLLRRGPGARSSAETVARWQQPWRAFGHRRARKALI